MSDITSSDERLARLLAAPFLSVLSAGAIVRAVKFTRPQTKVEQVPVVAASPAPAKTQIPTSCIADRVHSRMFGSVKVCFYQYVKAKCIRAVARKGGVTKELLFSPSLAAKRGTPYNMDSAIAYVREVGFKGIALTTDLAAFIPGVLEEHESAPVVASPQDVSVPPWEANPSQPPARSANATAVGAPSLQRGSKNPPLTGHIVFIGEKMMPGFDDKPPYKTFAIILRSESGSFEKQFIGEHLAELAHEHGLKTDDLITLQLLGKRPFTVVDENTGRPETRRRNEYSLTVHQD